MSYGRSMWKSISGSRRTKSTTSRSARKSPVNMKRATVPKALKMKDVAKKSGKLKQRALQSKSVIKKAEAPKKIEAKSVIKRAPVPKKTEAKSVIKKAPVPKKTEAKSVIKKAEAPKKTEAKSVIKKAPVSKKATPSKPSTSAARKAKFRRVISRIRKSGKLRKLARKSYALGRVRRR